MVPAKILKTTALKEDDGNCMAENIYGFVQGKFAICIEELRL